MHEHNHLYNTESDKKLIFSFVVKFFFAIFELVGGIYANSYAIASDSLHDISDSFIILVTIVLNRRATSSESKEFPFGKQRLRLIGSIFISLFLLVPSIAIIRNSFELLSNPEFVNSRAMFVMALVGIFANSIVLFKLRCSETKLDKALVLHFMKDVMGWIAVLVSSVVIHITGLYVIDPILSIIIAMYIVINSSRNLWSCIQVILLHNHKQIEEIYEVVFKYNNIIEYKDVKIIEIDDNHHVMCLSLKHDLKDLDKLKAELQQFHINDVYVSIECEHSHANAVV